MNPRLTKEFRPLLLPWAWAVAAAAGHLVVRPNSAYFHGALGDFILGLVWCAFATGVLVLAALPMGIELNQRTLTLLFTQPMHRNRLWSAKLFAASLMIASLAVVHGLAAAAMERLTPVVALFGAAFAITAVCSVGYHTLATRSILVGIASAVGLPYALTLCTYLIAHFVFGSEPRFSASETNGILIVASLVYSAFCLQLSRRQFNTLELKDTTSRAAQVPAAIVPRRLSELFRARPSGLLLNLIRKEVCLHKPIFLVSAIFAAAWVLTLLVMVLRPAWHENGVAVLNGLTGTQLVLMGILAGCVALGDDKALGTAHWHLTLPISARKQWLIKLLTAFGTTITVAVLLPTLLAVLTLFTARVGLLAAPAGEGLALAVPFLGVFILSFWSASMTPNTVRAALTCVMSLFGVAAMVALGVGLAESFSRTPLQTNFIAWLLAQFQASPAMPPLGQMTFLMLAVFLIGTGAALHQSLALFRRGESSASLRVKYAIILAAITFLGAFWYKDLTHALPAAQRQFETELGNAWALLPYRKQSSVDEAWPVSVQELEQTGELSHRTVKWIKGSKIMVTRTGVAYSRSPAEAFMILVEFPGGQTHAFGSVHSIPQPTPQL